MADLMKQLKTSIISNLKTFSELKSTYGVDSIYRTGESEFISELSGSLGLHGVPKNRKTLRLLEDSSTIDILEPIWYSSSIKDSIFYCNDKKEKLDEQKKYFVEQFGKAGEDAWDKFNEKMINDCVTHKYIPYDETKVKHKKILFLDLNGEKDEDEKHRPIYFLNHELIENIYKFIFSFYRHYLITVDDELHLPVTKDQSKTFSIEDIKAAYGYDSGTRWSEHYIDKFFTLELFHLMINVLNLQKELNCVIMGYFHGDVHSLDKPGGEINGYLSAEFAIPYLNSINKNYMEFAGIVAKGREIISSERKIKTAKSKSADKSPSQKKTTKKGGKTTKKNGKKRKTTKAKI